MTNQLKILGAVDMDWGDDGNAIESGLHATIAALNNAKPYFSFRTWQGKPSKEFPNPRVNHEWNGATEYTGNVSVNGAVFPTNRADSNPDGAENETPLATEPEASADEDLDALVAACDTDGDAQAKLKEIALAAGVDEAGFIKAKTWEAAKKLIVAARVSAEVMSSDGAGTEEEEESAPFKPEKEQIYKYKVIDKKTGKPVLDAKTKRSRPAVEVEVLAVNTKSKTVKVKNLDDGKSIYDDVPWDSLEDAS